jgi:hypothetical protein
MSRGGFEDSPSPAVLPSAVVHESDEDDDITLQDLVAMETLEDADVYDDDHFFALNSSTNPLEPFMNAILQSHEDMFSCERCGLHFGSMLEFRLHRESCQARSKGKKSASKSGGKAKVKSSRRPDVPDPEAMDVVKETFGQGSDPTLVAESIFVKTESSSNSRGPLDSASQPALGGAGAHWKCNQCKAIFESGPLLLQVSKNIKARPYFFYAVYIMSLYSIWIQFVTASTSACSATSSSTIGSC